MPEEFNVGECVRWTLSPDSFAVGLVREVEGERVRTEEAHAFHRLWGGSSVARGRRHELMTGELTPETHYENLVRRLLPS